RLFEKVLTRDPKKASIHYNLASAFFQLKRYADATRMYRSFLALRPTSHAGHFYLGQALAIQDDLAGAEREYEQARRLQPDHPATAYRLGLVLANLGRWEQARAMLERAVAQKSDDPWPRAQLANLKRRQGELEAAAAIHQQLAQQHPENQHFQLFYGESLLALGKLGEAEARFFAALRLQPGSKAAQHGQALLLCHRAREAMAAGDVAQARLLLTQSRGLAPASRPVQEGLALLQAREATPELRVEALATLTRLAREPGGISPGIAVARAELLALLGRAKEAEQALQQVQGAAATGSGSGSAGAGQGAGSGAKTGQGAGSGARTGQGAAAGARPGKETHERRVQHARALLLAAQGELDQAIRELEQLSQPPGAAAEVLRNLARLQVRRAGELLGKGKAAPARTLLLRAEKSADTLPPPQARQMRKLLVLSFLELREYPRALEGIKTLRKQNARDRPLLAELDYLEAYGHYRLGQNDRAWGLLQRHPELKQPGRVAELGRQLLHRQAALHLRRRRAQPSGQLLQQARALPGGESDVLRHDLALVDYFGGNKAA
ncbi:MAG: tetratricopeptide repeat protein, partial [Deltaproteobacteria bacterium]|nr:tetratricopeptide repeat protein [Deltaproteobacteria bacterium]